MAIVKRPGSAESRLEPYDPVPDAEPQQTGVTRMAAKKAAKAGTYKVGDNYYRFNEGDDLPEGAEFVAPDVVEQEERSLGPAPENRAKGKAPEGRDGL